MLVVNADDWGRSSDETDAALACFSQRRVTSVTAMTFMADSERAARIAVEHDIPVGLHLNLTQPLTAPGTDSDVVAEHRRLVTFLTRTRYSRFVLNPLLRRSLRSTFQAQLEEFIRLYRKPPTHFDGHRHTHLCMSMLFAAPIPRGQKVRRTFSFTIQEKGFVNWVYRRTLDRWVMKRYQTTDYFFALSQNMGDSRLDRIANLARDRNVELMTHPIVCAERERLLSQVFEHRMAGVARASYAEL